MPEPALLLIFIPTFFLISISPGLCMSLAMTLGMTVGVSKTLYMMLGEVLGVALVAILAVLGVAGLMLKYPLVFALFKWICAAYLCYLGFKMWNTPVNVAVNDIVIRTITPTRLFTQGFVTAVSNPKGWAFMVSVLPPFIDISKTITTQLLVLVSIIMISEFISMLIYANGGKWLKGLLNKGNYAQWINRIGGGLLFIIGIWLAIS